jgi:hypothetical protein
MAVDLYLPAFPQLEADLGASQTAVQFILTADVIGEDRRSRWPRSWAGGTVAAEPIDE